MFTQVLADSHGMSPCDIGLNPLPLLLGPPRRPLERPVVPSRGSCCCPSGCALPLLCTRCTPGASLPSERLTIDEARVPIRDGLAG